MGRMARIRGLASSATHADLVPVIDSLPVRRSTMKRTDAAYLYKFADDLNGQDDPSDVDDGAVNNLAAANGCVGVFNKLAAVDLFDNGVFEGAESILTDNGLFNMMQNRCLVGGVTQPCSCVNSGGCL